MSLEFFVYPRYDKEKRNGSLFQIITEVSDGSDNTRH